MVNTRGNTFSRGNRHHRDDTDEYWAMSMDELALIDLPTQIDAVLRLTGKPSLALVGHSQGCSLPLMLLSAKPEYNQKLWLLMMLGVVTHAEYIQAPHLKLQAQLAGARVSAFCTFARVAAGRS